MTSGGLLTPGFYWYRDGGKVPEVVEITEVGEVYFCGAEKFWYLPAACREDWQKVHALNGEFLGPLAMPAWPAKAGEESC